MFEQMGVKEILRVGLDDEARFEDEKEEEGGNPQCGVVVTNPLTCL